MSEGVLCGDGGAAGSSFARGFKDNLRAIIKELETIFDKMARKKRGGHLISWQKAEGSDRENSWRLETRAAPSPSHLELIESSSNGPSGRDHDRTTIRRQIDHAGRLIPPCRAESARPAWNLRLHSRVYPGSGNVRVDPVLEKPYIRL